jgi:2-polyprenyl-3-methyl-5-hydroxy-6-metoxy-1,4-benzoquinol methylase
MFDLSKNETFRPLAVGGGYYIVDPMPTHESLSRYYSESYYQHPESASYDIQYSEQEISHRRLKSAALIRSLTGCGAPKTVLDCGAGEGFLLAAAVDAGISPLGIDYSALGVDRWHPHLSNRLITGDIERAINSLVNQGRAFDACTLVNVLEHVLSPIETLSMIKSVLVADGLIAITVPNDYSTTQQLLADQGLISESYWFSPPQHLSYWNTESLPRFLTDAGFSIVDAYSDFPIEFYLLHPGSSYTSNRERNGPDAHKARLLFDLMIAEKGLDAYLDFYRALFRVGQGRNFTIVARPLS